MSNKLKNVSMASKTSEHKDDTYDSLPNGPGGANLLKKSSTWGVSSVQSTKPTSVNILKPAIKDTDEVVDKTLDDQEFPALGTAPQKQKIQNVQPKIFTSNDFPALGAKNKPFVKSPQKQIQTTTPPPTIITTITPPAKKEMIVDKPLKNTESSPVEEKKAPTTVESDLNDSKEYGILKISKLIKNKETEMNMFRFGTELKNLGTNINSTDELYKNYLGPWHHDSSQFEYKVLDIKTKKILPNCYTLPPLQPPQKMMDKFSDETLMYIFYKMPRSILQDTAAQELFNRNWRFHKGIRKWITKDTENTSNSDSQYIFFEPDIWERVEKQYTLTFDMLEDRSLNNNENYNFINDENDKIHKTNNNARAT